MKNSSEDQNDFETSGLPLIDHFVEFPSTSNKEIFRTMENTISIFRSLSEAECIDFASFFTENISVEHSVRTKQELLELCAYDQQRVREALDDAAEECREKRGSFCHHRKNPAHLDKSNFINDLRSTRFYISHRCQQLSYVTQGFNKHVQRVLVRTSRLESRFRALIDEHVHLLWQSERASRQSIESLQKKDFQAMSIGTSVLYHQVLLYIHYRIVKEKIMNMAEIDFLTIKKQIAERKISLLQIAEAEEKRKHARLKDKITKTFFPAGATTYNHKNRVVAPHLKK